MIEQYRNRVLALLFTILFHVIFICCIYFIKIGCFRQSEYEKKTFVEIAGVINKDDIASSSKATKSNIEKNDEVKPLSSNTIEKETLTTKKTTKKDLSSKSQDKLLSKNSEYVVDSATIKKNVDANVVNAFSKKASNDVSSSSGGSVLSKVGSTDGNGGLANIGYGGAGYSLNGRSIVGGGGVPVRPNTNKPVFGKIVIGILVNSEGIVIDAWVDINGTQISDSEIRRAAIAAAKATKFNSISASNNQRGKIVYNFKVK